jgi:hypothetical protein
MKKLRWYRIGVEYGAGEKPRLLVHLWRWTWEPGSK